MTQIMWKSLLMKLMHGEHLNADESEWFVDDLMKGNANPTMVGAVLATQQSNGLTAEEIAGASKAMVGHAVPLPVAAEATDIVGTGGDGAHTVNLSTMGAIVAAAAGVTVVKHGNRASSSQCGAADCLEALGMPLDLSPQSVAKIAGETGITFAFAKTFHPAMRFVGPVRAALGVPCVFNVLGPLTNPAHPKHVAIGCANRALSPIMAQVYAANGQTGMVYTSAEGLDEMAPTGPISVWEFRDGTVSEQEFDPTVELGLDAITIDDLRGGMPEVNAQAVRDFLAGKDVPFRTTALLNAASAIVADGRQVPANGTLAERFQAAYALAEQAVDSGKAEALLNTWIETAQRYAKAEAEAAAEAQDQGETAVEA
ncbi:anthranilate phosphoribosyltransferase [Bifidobacterium gallicum]|nr:anthranilate phosphoribosyltransferase [Bifidobacterium gallicum]KFI59140.1 anthranilate phosphoribosyltransferase [Bifidobacterium gallicum DSM 20093 = LMG 11596]